MRQLHPSIASGVLGTEVHGPGGGLGGPGVGPGGGAGEPENSDGALGVGTGPGGCTPRALGIDLEPGFGCALLAAPVRTVEALRQLFLPAGASLAGTSVGIVVPGMGGFIVQAGGATPTGMRNVPPIPGC